MVLCVPESPSDKPEALAHELGVKAEIHNLKFDELYSLLDIDHTAFYYSNYITVILPLYCRLMKGPFYSEAGKFLAQYVIHQSLQERCTAVIKSDAQMIKRVK